MYQLTGENILLVEMPSGWRRTVRIEKIEDLAETSSGSTEVHYRNGRSFTVPIPFDTMYELWMAKVREAEQQSI